MAKAKKKAASKKTASKKTASKKTASKKTVIKKGPAKPRAKKEGVGFFVESLLKKKQETEAILAAVKKKFPKAKTSPASLAWYRNKMREEGTLTKA